MTSQKAGFSNYRPLATTHRISAKLFHFMHFASFTIPDNIILTLLKFYCTSKLLQSV